MKCSNRQSPLSILPSDGLAIIEVGLYHSSILLFQLVISRPSRLALHSTMAAPPPCHDRPNNPGTQGPCQVTRQNCVDPAHGGVPYTVCDSCANEAATGTGAPGIRIDNLLNQYAKPQLFGHPPLRDHTNGVLTQTRDHGFRTLLCDDCIAREKELRRARHTHIEPPGYTIPWAQRRFMQNYPHDTCKCRMKAQRQDRPRRQSHRHCRQHRQELFDEMVAQRDRNEFWLERTARSRGGATIASRVATRRRRWQQGTHRACRCGKTVQGTYGSRPRAVGPPPRAPDAIPGVWQCLSCEGITHRTGSVFLNAGDFNPGPDDDDLRLGRRRTRGLA